MKYNTKQVKKNFLKERLIGILVILILTLTMVPCFTSCSHGNNPEKSKPEVENKNKKPDTPAAAEKYAVSFKEATLGGKLTAKVDGAAISSGTSVEKGKTVTFTAAPIEGYKVEK